MKGPGFGAQPIHDLSAGWEESHLYSTARMPGKGPPGK